MSTKSIFLLCTGPVPTTIGDFWRMVWEQNSRTIVMVTHVKEKFTVSENKFY